MNADIKQAMHVGAAKSFGNAEANENERRWSDEKIDYKNQDPTNHYDKSRMRLNFEIDKDGNIKPLGYHEKSL
ncbi:MAG: recombinase, partial [Muribaculaceae bacterium]|nr:recombinase [Muribaculaceae bacterium]